MTPEKWVEWVTKRCRDGERPFSVLGAARVAAEGTKNQGLAWTRRFLPHFLPLFPLLFSAACFPIFSAPGYSLPLHRLASGPPLYWVAGRGAKRPKARGIGCRGRNGDGAVLWSCQCRRMGARRRMRDETLRTARSTRGGNDQNDRVEVSSTAGCSVAVSDRSMPLAHEPPSPVGSLGRSSNCVRCRCFSYE